MYSPSIRANVVTRRTYNRELDDGSYETWEETIDRVISHQRWLWERAQDNPLFPKQESELNALRELMLSRKALPAGRTLWLGGTEVSKRREISQFNCSATRTVSVHDIVDVFWLLLNGCGVGFQPVPGSLNGFATHIPTITVIPSTRTDTGGQEHNEETYDPATRTWTLSVGDSAEAWAKSVGKLLAGKYPAEKLILDFSEIRPAGKRLKGYGWIANGFDPLARAYQAVAGILNRRAGQLLTHLDILDVVNWLGTVLSSRRSAQIALYPYGAKGWENFAKAKFEYYKDNPQRAQSNNSLLFRQKPSKAELERVFAIMVEAGGSEPGLVNQAELQRRAPYAELLNPCAEIALSGNGGLCNLVSVDLSKFDDPFSLHQATALISRANYRQTCVNLDDGILQRKWHENQEFTRLLGVSLTGIVQRPDLTDYDLKVLRNTAVRAACDMADELGTPHPKNVTTVKPEGTRSKISDCTEGAHRPPGRFIFNTVVFSRFDTLVPVLKKAGYKVRPHPSDEGAVLATFPVEWKDVEFDIVDGKHVNLETAVSQLERYRRLMRNYVDQNCSITVSYSPNEIPQIVDWLDMHWDDYVAVSFLPRIDPTKTAEDLGYPYLPQVVVTEEEFRRYADSLKPVSLDDGRVSDAYIDEECVTGACPVR